MKTIRVFITVPAGAWLDEEQSQRTGNHRDWHPSAYPEPMHMGGYVTFAVDLPDPGPAPLIAKHMPAPDAAPPKATP